MRAEKAANNQAVKDTKDAKKRKRNDDIRRYNDGSMPYEEQAAYNAKKQKLEDAKKAKSEAAREHTEERQKQYQANQDKEKWMDECRNMWGQ